MEVQREKKGQKLLRVLVTWKTTSNNITYKLLGSQKEVGRKNFEKITAANFLNLMKTIIQQIQEFNEPCARKIQRKLN